MREIEYRGIHPNLKRFITGLPAYGLDGELNMLQDNADAYYDVIPETIGQYTGLKDKNGKKIFEGDIVDWRGIKYKICIGEFGVMDFESEKKVDMACGVYGSPIGEELEPFSNEMQMNSVWIKYHNIEIIGNIYEQ